MKLSQKKRDALYRAIYDSLMDVRITLTKRGLSAADDVVIAQAETTIWRKALFALDVRDGER